MNPYQLINFGWGLLLLLGCWGIGNPLAKKAGSPGWTAAPLGVVIIILLAGWMDLASIANRTNMTLLILPCIGAGLIQWQDLWNAARDTGKTTAWLPWASGAVLAWMGSQAAQCGANWDDVSAYVPTCHELSAHGSSWAPMSLRRAFTWGGQFPLQNLGMLWSADYGSYVYERGLATWMMAIIGTAVAKNLGKWGGIPAIGIPLLAQSNINSAPAIILVPLLLTFWQLRQKPILAAAIAATLMALRSQMVPVSGLIVLWTLWETKGWKPKFQWIWKAGVVGIVALAPFICNQIQQFKTPLPILWPGTVNPAYFSMVRENTIENWKSVLSENIGHVLVLIWLVTQKPHRGLTIIAIVTFAYFVHAMPEYSNVEWCRYTWAIIATAVTAHLLQGKIAMGTAYLALIPMLMFPINIISAFHSKMRTHERWAAATRDNSIKELMDPWQATKAQQEVPAGTRLAILAFQSNLMDFSRNRIVNLDEFTGVGQFPKTGDPKEWKSWAQTNGIDFFMHTDMEKVRGGVITRRLFVEAPNPKTNLKHYQRVCFPLRIIGIDAMAELKKTMPHILKEDFLIYDLRPNSPELPKPQEAQKPTKTTESQ